MILIKFIIRLFNQEQFNLNTNKNINQLFFFLDSKKEK